MSCGYCSTRRGPGPRFHPSELEYRDAAQPRSAGALAVPGGPAVERLGHVSQRLADTGGALARGTVGRIRRAVARIVLIERLARADTPWGAGAVVSRDRAVRAGT